MICTLVHISRNPVGHPLSSDYFCTELTRNIDDGKTNYCYKGKNPFRIP